jgi:hypothetical protein
VEQKVENKRRRTGEYAGAVIAHAILFFVVNKIPDWNAAFLNSNYFTVLRVLNIAIIVQMVGNLMLIFYHPKFLHEFTQALFSVFGFIVLIFMLSFFPFDFEELGIGWLETVLRVLFIISLAATAISAAVHVIKGIAGIVRSI